MPCQYTVKHYSILTIIITFFQVHVPSIKHQPLTHMYTCKWHKIANVVNEDVET